MKIGLVLPSIPGYSETFFRNKISGLQQNGVEVILFVNDSKANENYLNCRVVKAPPVSGSKIRVIATSILLLCKAVFVQPAKSLKLYRLNKKEGITGAENFKSILTNQFLLGEKLDWLHFGFGTMALGKENLAAVLEAKMAVSFRGFDIGIYPIKHPGCYDLLYLKADKFHVISNDLKNLLFKAGLKTDRNIVKITPAIDTSFFNLTSISSNSRIQFSTIARLHWKKGLEQTLEALALLKDTVDFQYTIVGDGPEKERLVFAAHQLGISDRITFIGALTPEAVKEQLKQTTIYVQYSLQEGFCNAVLEAQAMGLMCVVSDAEGLSENVIHNQTGWVVPKRQPKLLAQKIKEVLALDEEQKQIICRQATERVQKEFNLEKQQQEFFEFYGIV